MMSFEEWLLSRDVDCQTLAPELETALQSQYDRELERLKPAPQLIIPADCSWPQRSQPVTQFYK